MSFDPSNFDAFNFWSDADLVQEIERLQAIQKRNSPMTTAWGEASSKLQPLFAAMAKRHPSSANEGANQTMTDKILAPIPALASDSLIERVSEMTREHVKNLQADPDLAAKLDSDPLAQRAYADELFRRKEIDLRARQFDIEVEYVESAPYHSQYRARDLLTFDGSPEGCGAFQGYGASKSQARMALLDLFSEYDGVEPRPRPPTRVISHTPFDPPDVVDGTHADWEDDDRE